jgi:two-component system sensor histidine kinase CreC
MTEPPRREKWRPSVGLIIFAVLASVATLPLVGLFFFRLYDNQLIHQTQAELIAQSRVLAGSLRARSRASAGLG